MGAGLRMNLHLIGPMRVTDASGARIVIRGRKAQAILALVALAPQMARARVWLRDRLWSGADEARSATSLRQSLFELRRDLGPLAGAVLEAGPDTVALNPEAVWVDHRAVQADPGAFARLGLGADAALLEGMDIADPEFEEWLRDARLDWADTAEALAAARPVPCAMPDPGVRPPLRLAVLRSVIHGGDGLGEHLADQLLERVAGSLREVMPLRVLDLRGHAAPIEDLAESAEAEFLCRLRVLSVGRKVTLTFLLYRAAQMAMEWNQSVQCDLEELLEGDSLLLMGFAAQVVDRLARTLATHLPGDDGATAPLRAGQAAMSMLFRLDDGALDQALALLERAGAAGGPPHSLIAGLQVYAASFSVGENIGRLPQHDRDRLHRLIDSQLADAPFNSVTLACLGHVLGYVFQDHDLAGRVLERAVALNPAQPFAWDHLALHNIYTGDYAAALRHAGRAARLGAFSPIAYSYDTTLAMAATLSGDHARAAQAGRRALSLQPRFKAAMRYLMVAEQGLGQHAAARATRDRLLLADPDFADAEVRRLRFGLTRAGADHPVLRLIDPLME